jgi:hypothetical protein
LKLGAAKRSGDRSIDEGEVEGEFRYRRGDTMGIGLGKFKGLFD